MENDSNKALNYAFRLLGIRPRSVFEIKRKLKERRFDKEIIAVVISKLEELELLDDEKFARDWLEDRLKYRACGRLLARKKLMEKRISEEIINNVLEELLPQEKEIKLARKIVENNKRPRQKLILFLKSKGFRWEIISEVLNS